MTTTDPIAAFRSELHAAALRQRRSSRRRLVAAAVVVFVAIVALTGVATGGVGWLSGTPAPQSVITDFGS
jgi:ferric-dicitrate binding protein FerR (iron transport regulator)